MVKKKIEIKESVGTTLSFRRALEITDGAMFSLNTLTSKESPIVAYRHGMRTTKGYDTQKPKGGVTKDNGEDSGNLSYMEMAKLNSNDDTLKIKFSVTFLPIYCNPEIADSEKKRTLVHAKNTELINDEEVLDKLSKFYAYQIINGSWCWRNRDVSNEIDIIVSSTNFEKDLIINKVRNMSLNPVLTIAQKELGMIDPLIEHEDKYMKLSLMIKDTFQGKKDILCLKVVAELKMQDGATVYPSQLFQPIIEKIGKSPLGKVLYKMPFNGKGVGQTGITGEKINNALRKFDLVTNDEGIESIISIDPNGSDLVSRSALRKGNKRLISLYEKLLFKEYSQLELDEKVFITGCLIRGGLFSEGK